MLTGPMSRPSPQPAWVSSAPANRPLSSPGAGHATSALSSARESTAVLAPPLAARPAAQRSGSALPAPPRAPSPSAGAHAASPAAPGDWTVEDDAPLDRQVRRAFSAAPGKGMAGAERPPSRHRPPNRSLNLFVTPGEGLSKLASPLTGPGGLAQGSAGDAAGWAGAKVSRLMRQRPKSAAVVPKILAGARGGAVGDEGARASQPQRSSLMAPDRRR